MTNQRCKRLGHAWKCLSCGECRDGANPNDFWKDIVSTQPIPQSGEVEKWKYKLVMQLADYGNATYLALEGTYPESKQIAAMDVCLDYVSSLLEAQAKAFVEEAIQRIESYKVTTLDKSDTAAWGDEYTRYNAAVTAKYNDGLDTAIAVLDVRRKAGLIGKDER